MRPIFDWFFIYPLVEDEITFESDHHIKYINRPIVILHAEDDTVINSSLTNKVPFHISSSWNPSCYTF